jgi:hypothetical protein
MGNDSNIPIYEQYESYQPSFDVKRAIHRMLGSVPDKYLVGIGSIVLTSESALTGKRARRMTWSRGRKVSAAKARGLYHPAWGSNPAWIELHIDSIFTKYPFWFRFPLIREMQLGDVFFHELGHHIHARHQPEFKEKEDVAEAWKRKTGSSYMWRRFWYLTPLFGVLKWADRVFDIRGRLKSRVRAKAAHDEAIRRSPTRNTKA